MSTHKNSSNEEVGSSFERRDFLKKFGLGAFYLLGINFLTKYFIKESYARDIVKLEKKKRYAMAIDLNRCVGCFACQYACKQENNTPLGKYRTWVKQAEKGVYPNVKKISLPFICNHCENPICIRNCPVKASYQTEDGVVLIDYDRCVGCKYCIVSCPYNVRFVNEFRRTADKCTFCIHRVEKGLEPACVATCMTKARIFGDIKDPDSQITKYISKNYTQVLKPENNTIPMVFYIGLDILTIEAGKQEFDYMKYYRRTIEETLDVNKKYLKENHKILSGISEVDRKFKYQRKFNKIKKG